ncbi:MAG: sulfite exporter TauE/SafE family protein [Deltaproteobacteria bacterium]|nr:MAG: sulfite exporter TauE/SafE family protein [Deltaproteobacteria bacterium]
MDESVQLLLYLGAGLCSGFLNTIASAGSALTLPLMIFLGLPANIANGTNRVQIAVGRISSIVSFQRSQAIDWRNAIILSVPCLLGAIIGASIATVLQSKYIGWAITFAVIAVVVVLVSNPKRLLKDQKVDKLVVKWWHLCLFFAIGLWGGFIVLDASTYALMVLVLGIGYDLKKANAIKAVAIFPMTITSMAIFAWAGEVDWRVGLILSLGSVIGAWIGAALAVKEEIKIWIYRILIVILVLEIYQLVSRYFFQYHTWLETVVHRYY